MPVELRNAACFPDGLCHFERSVRVTLMPLLVRILARGVQKVKAHENHVLAASLVDVAQLGLCFVVLRGVLAVIFEWAFRHDTANHVLAEIVEQEIVELLCAFGWFWRDRCRGDAPRACLVFRELNVVEVDVAPAVDDANLVFACSELDFARTFDGREFVRNSKRNLPRRYVVDGQILNFVGRIRWQLVCGP